MSCCIGIDVSKAKLDVLWLRDPGKLKVKSKVFANEPKGHAQLLTWLSDQTGQPLEQIHVVMEATGVYHETLAYFLHDHAVKVSVVNPAYIRDFAKSLGTVHKTDKKDSVILARYGAQVSPELWEPEPVEVRELKAMLARLRGLEADLQRENNRLEKAESSPASPVVSESLHKMIDELKRECERLEKEIDDHIDRHPGLKKDRALLQSIPGVGQALSRTMLSVIRGRDFKNAGACAAYLGLIPKHHESGVLRGRTVLSKKGPSSVRAQLYMPAIVASQWNPTVRAQKERLLRAGKNKMQALGAAMRKLVHLCFGVLKHQIEYTPQAA